MKLNVKRLPDDDAWRDMVRIPHQHRLNLKGDHISRGCVCKITANGKSGYVVVRGYEYKDGEKGQPLIFIDSTWRGELNVKPDVEYEFTLEPGGTVAEWRWIWRARDPLIRIPAQICLISFFLGLLALLLAIPPLVDWVREHFKSQATETSGAPAPGPSAPPTK